MVATSSPQLPKRSETVWPPSGRKAKETRGPAKPRCVATEWGGKEKTVGATTVRQPGGRHPGREAAGWEAPRAGGTQGGRQPGGRHLGWEAAGWEAG